MERLDGLVRGARSGIRDLLDPLRWSSSDYRYNDWSWVRSRFCRLWSAVENLPETESYRQQVAILAENAVRKISIKDLTRNMVKAARVSCRVLYRQSVSLEDVTRTRRAWEAAGIEILPNLGAAIPLREVEIIRLPPLKDEMPLELKEMIAASEAAQEGQVLREYRGKVNRVDDRGAICSLFNDRNEEAITTFDADEMSSNGIGPDDPFNVRLVKRGEGVVTEFAFIPARELTDEELEEIERRVAELREVYSDDI